MARAIGRNTPPDWGHVEKYPLATVAPEARPTHVPVTVGFNWYEAFDHPVKGSDGVYRLSSTNLGNVRGGHCFCLEPAKQPDQPGEEQDITAWWNFYNQGEEGACEGFGHSRALSLLFRKSFDAFWLYDDAQRVEGTYVPHGGSVDAGSTNRSAGAALVKWGAHYETGEHCKRTPWYIGAPGVQIKEYRWATTVEEVLSTLGIPSSVGEVPFLNSWGPEDYPHVVMMPDVVLDRLLKEEGEADIFIEK